MGTIQCDLPESLASALGVEFILDTPDLLLAVSCTLWRLKQREAVILFRKLSHVRRASPDVISNDVGRATAGDKPGMIGR